MKRPISLVLALGLTLGGCYSFQPFDRASAPEPGSDVRVEIGPAGNAEVFRRDGQNGPSDAGTDRFRGAFIEWTPDTLVVRTVSPGITAEFETLRIPGRFVRSAEIMELDPRKTALTVLGAAAVVGVVVATQFDAAGGSPPGGGSPPDGGGFRAPLLRIVIPN